MKFKDYVTKKSIKRQISDNTADYNRDLMLLFKAMNEEEKARLTSRKATIYFNDDVRDLKDIKEHYALSWNELRTIIKKHA